MGKRIKSIEFGVLQNGIVASKKVIFAALAGNFLIALTKFIAFVLTGSSAMLSEKVHSVVDTGNQILLLYGLRRAKMPASQRFPFGHGKEVYFWSFVVASVIIGLILAGTAAWLAYETKGLLIGENARPAVVKGVREIAKSYPKIKRVFVESEARNVKNDGI